MTVLASESFTGVDANPIGGNWTTIASHDAIKRVSNTATNSVIGGFNGATYNAYSAPNDSYVKFVFSAFVGTGSGGPMGRVTSNQEYYYAEATQDGFLRLVKRNFGFTTLGSVSYTASPGDVIEWRGIGTTISAWVNGVSQISVTDSDFSSGSWGLIVNSGSGGPTFSSFEGGDFASGGFAAIGSSGGFGGGVGALAVGSGA